MKAALATFCAASLLSFPFLQSEDRTLPESRDITLARDVNDFGLALYAQIHDSPNVIFSPYSSFTGLSLLYLGARGETAGQIAKALHLSIGVSELPLTTDSLAHAITARRQENSYELSSANAIWLDKDCYILSDFRHIAETSFYAKVESVDFSDEEKTRSIVNEWTSNQTKGLITKLLQQGDLSPQTRILLTNALYFKGLWQSPFDTKLTKENPFTTDNNSSLSVQMMEQTSHFPYYENEKMQMAALPFRGSNIQKAQTAFVILVPKKGQTLADLETLFTDFSFRNWIEGLDKRLLHIRIPSFTLTMRNTLNDILKHMGMGIAFTKKANFVGIDGMQDLFLSKVVHESYFALDENGVTAAAATAAAMNVTSSLPADEKPIELSADRPFLFALVELNTKTILFFGKFSQPSEVHPQ